MKRSLLTLLFLSSFTFANDHKTGNPEPIRLTSDILKFIDGKHFGIDGEAIITSCRVRIDLRKRLSGIGLAKNENKICFYNGTYYTIKDMVILEKNLRKSGALDEDVYRALGASLYTTKRALLEEIAFPLLDRIRRIKKYAVLLIKESCEKHKRADSILLNWENTDDEHEVEVFMNKIDSFNALGFFCFDLIHLIGDIIHSCPIAYQQFEEMKHNYYATESENVFDQAK